MKYFHQTWEKDYHQTMGQNYYYLEQLISRTIKTNNPIVGH